MQVHVPGVFAAGECLINCRKTGHGAAAIGIAHELEGEVCCDETAADEEGHLHYVSPCN